METGWMDKLDCRLASMGHNEMTCRNGCRLIDFGAISKSIAPMCSEALIDWSAHGSPIWLCSGRLLPDRGQ